MARHAVNAPPLALYVHIPWCVRKCPYCDFNSHTAPEGLPENDYVAAVLADLDQDLRDYAPALDGRPVISVFFGGGTPSLFSAAAIAAILDGARTRLPFAPAAEITLETNPGTVEHGRFEDYRRAGVDRLSFGVQSFDDDKLKRLGRIHSASEVREAIRLARGAGYDNFNLDLMYALPQQDLAGALADVDAAISLAPSHISHYQLTLEPNTAFARTPPPLPDDDLAWDMQEACQQRLADAGFAHYETSAYARDGLRSVHNVNYWEFGDYLGIGAGAHGKLSDAATGSVRRRWKVRAPRAFLAHAGSPRGIGADEAIAAEQLPFEFMLNALRLEHGVARALFAERTGLADAQIAAALADGERRGWFARDDARIVATDLGRRFLNDAITLFLP
ncbi:MAG TPA: radical SAM family heme chaperone HemW [Tahibacter sp.]|uniref:radical SAM family heme chaperone HemW n=1 Tax=Tahibacter sp. TaxID=2056211 RepID=UPI002CB201AC|nr:radical SAM family heme chaperone HemW [Tahibacter sp.]HSX62497.1 radical SAM family heme chaperone HemW [Tahibacter sp.]